MRALLIITALVVSACGVVPNEILPEGTQKICQSPNETFDSHLEYESVKRGIVYRGVYGAQLPTVNTAPNGDWLIVWNTGTDMWPGTAPHISRSGDDGDSWSEKTLINPKPDSAFHTNTGLSKLSDGKLYMPYTEGTLNPGWEAGNHTLQASAKVSILSSFDGYLWTDEGSVSDLGHSIAHGKIVEYLGEKLTPIWVWRKLLGESQGQVSGYSTDKFTRVGEYGETALLPLPSGKLLAASKKPQAEPSVRFSLSENGVDFEELPAFYSAKNTALHLSPNEVPLTLSYPWGIGYSLNEGRSWYHGYKIEPLVGETAYGIDATNLPDGTILIVYSGKDQSKPETAQYPKTMSTKHYVGYEIVREKKLPGSPDPKTFMSNCK